jgi:hypothetical protein
MEYRRHEHVPVQNSGGGLSGPLDGVSNHDGFSLTDLAGANITTWSVFAVTRIRYQTWKPSTLIPGPRLKPET